MGGRFVASQRVCQKNASRPRGPPGPRPTRGGGLGRGLRAAAQCWPPGKCPFLDPIAPTRVAHPAPFPPRQTRPPPPPQAPGAASASARPPRTAQPDGFHAPSPQVTPGRPWAPASGHAIRLVARGTRQPGSVQAPPSAPAPLSYPDSRDRAPAVLSTHVLGPGGAPRLIRLRAVAPGRALPGHERRANFGRTGDSRTSRQPCGRGAPALRLGGRADPPLGRRLAAADPGASGLRARRRGSRRDDWGEAHEDPPPCRAGCPRLGDGTGGGSYWSQDASAEGAAGGSPREIQGTPGASHRSRSLTPFSFPPLLEWEPAALGGDSAGGCTAGAPVLSCRARRAPRGAAPGGARGGAAGIAAPSLRWGEGAGGRTSSAPGSRGARVGQ